MTQTLKTTIETTTLPSQPNKARRLFIGGSVLALYSWGSSNAFGSVLASSNNANSSESRHAFLSVSLLLSGHRHLPAAQTKRVYQALVTLGPTFSEQVTALASFITHNKLSASTLQAALDNEKADFAALPRQILQGWYVGVVGTGVNARCIDYQDALMNVAVNDQLRPPSYAYGAYGSWKVQPILHRMKDHA
jgi:hypothetical protein